MGENSNQNQEQQPSHLCTEGGQYNRSCKEPVCWLKYLVITLAAFAGAFFAVYFIADIKLHEYFTPHLPPPSVRVEDLDDILREQDRMMQDLMRLTPNLNPFFINPVKLQTFQDNDEYKIILDLKPFGGNENNIKVDVTPTSVKVSGKSQKKDKHNEDEVSFYQSFALPKKADPKGVTKEKNGNRYVITIPIADEKLH